MTDLISATSATMMNTFTIGTQVNFMDIYHFEVTIWRSLVGTQKWVPTIIFVEVHLDNQCTQTASTPALYICACDTIAF